jgi:hypothetical protein
MTLDSSVKKYLSLQYVITARDIQRPLWLFKANLFAQNYSGEFKPHEILTEADELSN